MTQQKKLLLLTLCVTVFSIVMRVIFPSTIEYKQDQIQAIEIASKFLNKPQFLAQGPSSSWGFTYFPLFFYVIALLKYIAHDPQSISITIAALNGFAIGVFCFLFSKKWGMRVVGIGSFLWACSPWMIRYSRIIWAPSIQLIAIPFVYFLITKIGSLRNKAVVVVVGIFFSFFVQIYPSSLFFIPMFLLLLHTIDSKILLFGSGFLLGMIPSILYVLNETTQKSICPTCIKIAHVLSNKNPTSIEHLIRPFQLPGALGFQEIVGSNFGLLLQQSVLLLLLPILWIICAIVAGFGMYIFSKQSRSFRQFSLFFVGVLTFYVITGTGNYMHYHIFLAPVIFLSIAYAVEELRKAIPKTITLLPYIFVCFVIIGNTFFVFAFYTMVSQKKVFSADYGEIYELSFRRANPYIKAYNTSNMAAEIATIAYMGKSDLEIQLMLIGLFINNNEFSEATKLLSTIEKQQTIDLQTKQILNILRNKLPH